MSLRDDMQRRLLDVESKLPTSSLARFGKTAMAALRSGRLTRRGKADSPADVDALAAVVSGLGQLKGVAMKAGQLLSYLDLDLPEELRSALAALQTHSPPMSFERLAEVVEKELGPRAAALLAGMTRTPAAAASIGQVHRAVLPNGTEVAVKVQYPDVVKAFEADFRSAAVGKMFVSLVFPGATVDDVLKKVRQALLEECDYEREARYQQRFRRLYAHHPTLVVPAVHPEYSSKLVLTTTWMHGSSFDSFLASSPTQSERNRAGEAIFEFYVGSLLRHRLYNWDPHPGNYLFPTDGHVVMLDYGSTREFSKPFVEQLVTLERAAFADDRALLHEALVALGMVREGMPYDFDSAREFVRSFFGPILHDEVRSIEHGEAIPLRLVLANKRKLLKLKLPGELLFVLRIRFGVMSVLSRLGAQANWYRLERGFTQPD